MDTRSDRGQFYPGGATSSVPAEGATDKVDRVNLGEVGESYTLKDVKQKVNQIVRAIAPAVSTLIFTFAFTLSASAATAPLEDIPNTAPVVTNEEDAVAMAAVGDLRLQIADLRLMTNDLRSATNDLRSSITATSNNLQSSIFNLQSSIAATSNNLQSSIFNLQSQLPNYALKSELPTDYIRENDITNFATRSWISAQGYASGAEVGARIDAQDNAIAAATNAQNAAISATSNALAQAHAADVAALRMGTNRLDQAWRTGTNALAQAHRTDIAALKSGTNTLATTLRQATNALTQADARLDAKIDALELTGGMTRLWTSDATTFQDATGVVWEVSEVYAWTGTAETLTTGDVNAVQFYPVPGSNLVWTTGTGTNLIYDSIGMQSYCIRSGEWYWYEENYAPLSATNLTFVTGYERYTLYISKIGNLTNAVNRVAYTNDVAATANAAYEAATNYTDAATNALAASIGPADRITDGTNTIDAAGNVWGGEYAPWVLYGSTFVWNSSVHAWTNDIYYIKYDARYKYLAYYDSTYGLIAEAAPIEENALSAELVYVEGAGEGVLGIATRESVYKLLGRLALTNEIPTVDYTTSNTQLVATIEATAPAPGNYSTVSNAAMNARTKADMAVYTNAVGFTDWTFRGDGSQNANDALEGASPIVGDYDESMGSWFIVGLSNGYAQAGPTGGDRNSTTIEFYVLSESDIGTACTITATRSIINIPIATGDELSTTGYVASAIGDIRTEIPDTNAIVQAAVSASTNYTDIATNALAQTIPQGGGTPEWRVVNVALDFPASILYVTNGCVVASFGSSSTLNYVRTGWPDGAAMFVRLVGVPQSYTPYCPESDSGLHLVGYGTWPTNDFQSVWWRSGTNVFVNVLVEE